MYIAMIQVSGVWEVLKFAAEENLLTFFADHPIEAKNYTIYEVKQIHVDVQSSASIRK